MRRAVAILALLSLGGCMVGPNYHAPKLATPPAFGEQALANASADRADLSAWWKQLGDPTLDSLIDRAFAENLDVKTAASRLREARLQITVARAALFPTASGSAIAARRDAQSGSSGAPPAAAGATGAPTAASGAAASAFSLPKHLEVYSLGVDAQWEIDIFGGTQRGIESAEAQAQAAHWQARDAQVALSAEVARAYMTLRLAQARRAEADADVARLTDLFSLLAARRKAGVVTELDVNQQRQALQARQAQIPQLDQQARGAIHALSVLLAQPPMALQAELATPRPMPASPVALPVGLPSELLARRPDVRVAERNLAAATAQIGVATAALYPKLDLLALASFASRDFSSLLSRKNFSTIGAADGSWTLFDAGRGRANVAAKREAATQADLAYRKALLTALQEVEDALSARAADSQQEASLAQDLKTAQDTATLADARYKAGLTPFIDVLQAQGAVTQASDQLLSAQAAVVGDAVSLFTALGGGWTP
ncbi:MAG TPA: efflux transporter outer membrane subunit [Phenylobacterium sp.]|jgi:NodT family efflux transporter outer membrane factor (OMF) lipoprotein|uniref:efflux transporter outer membrane subunit n=1 Tax=Phenylobacterium sp. TaxID=1871053 RepID=UPI002D323C1D|nr:efflux transporter outer membrane subunit [Phenylobacterium sp.]HZZ67415.1 efflux transporter outer membrane subunit [Phenylobacterium sp.]